MKGHAKKPSGVALLIGISQYAHLEPLRMAQRDAQALAEALSGHGFARDSVHLLIDESAHRDAIAQAFDYWLPTRARGAGTAFFYFAGHGVTQASDPSGEPYLMPFDAAPGDPARSGIAMSEVARWIDRIEADRVIVCFECCRLTSETSSRAAGGTSGGRAELRFPATTFRWSVDAPPSGRNRFLIASDYSCDEGPEFRELKHGRFTHHLLQGIKEIDLDKAKTNLVVDLLTQVWESITEEGSQRSEKSILPSYGESVSGKAGFSSLFRWVVAPEAVVNVSSSTAVSDDDSSDDDGGQSSLVDDQLASEDLMPDFFQDEDDTSLRSRTEWLNSNLGLGDQFFARFIGVEVGTFRRWRESRVSLSASQTEGLQQLCARSYISSPL